MSPDASTQKPRLEITEETHETLSLLDLDRKPRDEKMALEQAFLAGAHEVRYHERAFKPRHHQDIEAIRDAVDALVVERRAHAPPPAPAPVAPSAPVAIRRDHREALQPLVHGKLVSVETVYHVPGGDVVEATYEVGDAPRKSLYVIRDGEAKPFDDIASRIDALPTPAAPQPAPAPAPAPATAAPAPPPAPEPTKKGGLVGRFARKKEAPAQAEEKPAKKGIFGRKEKPAAPEAAAPPAEAAPEEPRKRRFGFGKK